MLTVESIECEILPDDYPDLSWLDQTDAEMGEGYEASAAERKDAYNRGDWHMVGVRVAADVLIPHGDCYIVQRITSPGLWGIESDSGDNYFAQVAREELATLADMLREMNAEPDSLDAAIAAFTA